MAPKKAPDNTEAYGTIAEIRSQIGLHTNILLRAYNLVNTDNPNNTRFSIAVTRAPTNNPAAQQADYVAIVVVHDLTIQRPNTTFIQGKPSTTVRAAMEALLDASAEMMHKLFTDGKLFLADGQHEEGGHGMASSGGRYWDGKGLQEARVHDAAVRRMGELDDGVLGRDPFGALGWMEIERQE